MVVIEEISQDDDDDIVDKVELSSEALLLLKESIGTAGSDLGQFDGAWSVALLEDLRLCVAERNGCRLQLVQPSNLEEGCSTIPVIEALEDVQGILRDGPFIWVADMGTHRVTRIDASTGEITASVGDGSLRYPRCLCMQRSRRGELDDPTAAGPHLPSRLLYVGDSGNSRVVAYDVDTLTEVRAFGHEVRTTAPLRPACSSWRSPCASTRSGARSTWSMVILTASLFLLPRVGATYGASAGPARVLESSSLPLTRSS